MKNEESCIDTERSVRETALQLAKRLLAEGRTSGHGVCLGIVCFHMNEARATPDEIGTNWDELNRLGSMFIAYAAPNVLDRLRGEYAYGDYRTVRGYLRHSRALSERAGVSAVTVESLGTTERELCRLRRLAMDRPAKVRTKNLSKRIAGEDQDEVRGPGEYGHHTLRLSKMNVKVSNPAAMAKSMASIMGYGLEEY